MGSFKTGFALFIAKILSKICIPQKRELNSTMTNERKMLTKPTCLTLLKYFDRRSWLGASRSALT
jgi:hypothetical protein